MKVKDAVSLSIATYPSLYYKGTFEDSKFSALHHFFIVLGNGIEWARPKNPKKGGYLTSPKYYKRNGDWIRKHDLSYGKQKFELDPRFFKEQIYALFEIDKELLSKFKDINIKGFGNIYPDFNTKDEQLFFESDLSKIKHKYVIGYGNKYTKGVTHILLPQGFKQDDDLKLLSARENPYPSFSKEYSCFWKIEPSLIQDDWREEGYKHLLHWRKYFDDHERVKFYSYYHIGEKNKKDLKEWIEKRYPKEQGWIDKVAKDYEFPNFDGDNFEEMSKDRWKKELEKTKNFLDETLARLYKG